MANIDPILEHICDTVYELKDSISNVVEELGPKISVLYCADREKDRYNRPSYRFTFIISRDYTERDGNQNGR